MTEITQLTSGDYDDYGVVATFQANAKLIEQHHADFCKQLAEHQPTPEEVTQELKKIYGPDYQQHNDDWTRRYTSDNLQLQKLAAAIGMRKQQWTYSKDQIFLHYLANHGITPIETKEVHI